MLCLRLISPHPTDLSMMTPAWNLSHKTNMSSMHFWQFYISAIEFNKIIIIIINSAEIHANEQSFAECLCWYPGCKYVFNPWPACKIYVVICITGGGSGILYNTLVCKRKIIFNIMCIVYCVCVKWGHIVKRFPSPLHKCMSVVGSSSRTRTHAHRSLSTYKSSKVWHGMLNHRRHYDSRVSIARRAPQIQ